MTSTKRRPIPFERAGFPTMEALKEVQARERRSASTAEIMRAESLGDLRADVCPKCDGARSVGVRVKPGEPAVAMPCECMPLAERAFLAHIPTRFAAATLDTFERRAGSEDALAFAGEWDGVRSVVLWGVNGTGKTRLGCAMLLARLEKGYTARCESVADLMDDMRALFDGDDESSQAYLYRVSREPLLMLDDVGAEQDSAWTRERMATLIDRRYRTQAPTIITTNLNHKQLAERYGRRLADRLYEWRFVRLEGGSVRREMAGAS